MADDKEFGSKGGLLEQAAGSAPASKSDDREFGTKGGLLDTATQSASKVSSEAPEWYGFTPSHLVSEAGHEAGGILGGVAQLVTHPVDTFKGLYDTVTAPPTAEEQSRFGTGSAPEKGYHPIDNAKHIIGGELQTADRLTGATKRVQQAKSGDVGGALARTGVDYAAIKAPEWVPSAVDATVGKINPFGIPVGKTVAGATRAVLNPVDTVKNATAFLPGGLPAEGFQGLEGKPTPFEGPKPVEPLVKAQPQAGGDLAGKLRQALGVTEQEMNPKAPLKEQLGATKMPKQASELATRRPELSTADRNYIYRRGEAAFDAVKDNPTLKKSFGALTNEEIDRAAESIRKPGEAYTTGDRVGKIDWMIKNGMSPQDILKAAKQK